MSCCPVCPCRQPPETCVFQSERLVAGCECGGLVAGERDVGDGEEGEQTARACSPLGDRAGAGMCSCPWKFGFPAGPGRGELRSEGQAERTSCNSEGQVCMSQGGGGDGAPRPWGPAGQHEAWWLRLHQGCTPIGTKAAALISHSLAPVNGRSREQQLARQLLIRHAL